jgi:hypothetical protein
MRHHIVAEESSELCRACLPASETHSAWRGTRFLGVASFHLRRDTDDAVAAALGQLGSVSQLSQQSHIVYGITDFKLASFDVNLASATD